MSLLGAGITVMQRSQFGFVTSFRERTSRLEQRKVSLDNEHNHSSITTEVLIQAGYKLYLLFL